MTGRPTSGSRPIVFLHIPKTAGQTIHCELQRIVGPDNVSPVRVHTQVAPNEPQMPSGYRLYSGHIDWCEIDGLLNPFAFTVLRDPQERIASFYFYLLKAAQNLSGADLEAAENRGKKVILEQSASDYFFGGDADWQAFICDHYDNVYCHYFATRKVRGRPSISHLTLSEKIAKARHNLAQITRFYSTRNLSRLEDDVQSLTGQKPSIAGHYVNAGHLPQKEPRWPRLIERLERDKDVERLRAFTDMDRTLLRKIDLQV